MNISLVKPKDKTLSPHRKSHVAFIHKGAFYIHGGQDENEQITDSIYSFDLLKQVWEAVIIQGETSPLAEHKCAIICNEKTKKSSLFVNKRHSLIEKNVVKGDSRAEMISQKSLKKSHSNISKNGNNSTTTKKHRYIAKEFKVYLFGGRFKKDAGNNLLWCIKREGLVWKKNIVETKGLAPKPRIQHSMCHLSSTKYIVIMGGTNIVPEKTTGSELYKDFFLFDIVSNSWLRLEINEYQIQRSNAATCDTGDAGVLIFGGIGEENFIDGSIYKLTLFKEDTNPHVNTSDHFEV